MNTPTNTDDVIDSRDVIERIEELEAEIEELRQESGDTEIDDIDEYVVLCALAEQGQDSPDWPHGETLIRDSYFQDYAQELAEDCGDMPNGDQWPARCIDWEQATCELQLDYMRVDFDGVEYWIRA